MLQKNSAVRIQKIYVGEMILVRVCAPLVIQVGKVLALNALNAMSMERRRTVRTWWHLKTLPTMEH